MHILLFMLLTGREHTPSRGGPAAVGTSLVSFRDWRAECSVGKRTTTAAKLMQTAIERRRHARCALRLPASVRGCRQSELFQAQTENISCDGVSFRSVGAFALGALVEICMELGGLLGSSHRHGSLVCVGRVVQAESDDPALPFRYGCEILDYGLAPAEAPERHPVGAVVQARGSSTALASQVGAEV